MAKSDIRQLGKELFANLKENDKAVIRIDDLVKKIQSEVDLTDVPMEEFEKVYIERQIYPLATELAWASVVRGHKYYIDMNICDNPHYWNKVIEESNMDIQTKRMAKAKREQLRKNIFEMPGQYSMNLNTMNPYDLEEEKTTEEILEMLADEA